MFRSSSTRTCPTCRFTNCISVACFARTANRRSVGTPDDILALRPSVPVQSPVRQSNMQSAREHRVVSGESQIQRHPMLSAHLIPACTQADCINTHTVAYNEKVAEPRNVRMREQRSRAPPWAVVCGVGFVCILI